MLISNGKKASISGASGAITRQSSTTTRPKEKLRAKYEKFQKDDGVPIYLKGGLPDRLLFGFTLVLVAIGTVDAIGSLIQMAFKKKWNIF